MNIRALSATELAVIIAVVLIVVAGTAAWLFVRRRRTERLRSKFGSAEHDRAVKESGNQRQAETRLKKRTERVEGLHVRPLGAADHARFVEAWHRIQARFVDGPASAVTEADQLLGELMSTRGYPISDFGLRAADISVDHPLVVENYRTGHEIALRQMKGQASSEDLRQAMIHYRTLFGELVGEPGGILAQAAS